MGRFVEGADRGQSTLLPECLDDWIGDENPVRVIDAFVDALDLGELGFDGVEPASTGRPGYRPATLLKLYVYGFSTAYSRQGHSKNPSSYRLDGLGAVFAEIFAGGRNGTPQLPDHGQSEIAEGRQRTRARANTATVFVHGYVAHVMELVLDSPMGAVEFEQAFGAGLRSW